MQLDYQKLVLEFLVYYISKANKNNNKKKTNINSKEQTEVTKIVF